MYRADEVSLREGKTFCDEVSLREGKTFCDEVSLREVKTFCDEVSLREGKTFCHKFSVIVIQLSLVTRKPVFGVCDQVRLTQACSATETS